ncbi:MAG: hypothetical protein ACJ739_15995 [Acidimicrobiales bacterium]
MRVVAVLGVVLVLSACHQEPEADPELFCARLGRLTENDPFLAFGDTATPDEIREGFTALVERADELADVAPDEIEPAAEDYADATTAMDDLMADAGYDGARLDARAYRDEQERYTDASERLLNYLDASC